MPHNSHNNLALWIKFGTVNRKSISYNLPLKLLMQRSTGCSHCRDNHRARVTMEYLRQVTPEFIWPDLWPPNSHYRRPELCQLQSLGLSSGLGVSETRTWCWWAEPETASGWGVVTLQSGHHWWGHRWVKEATSGMCSNEETSFWTFDVNWT